MLHGCGAARVESPSRNGFICCCSAARFIVSADYADLCRLHSRKLLYCRSACCARAKQKRVTKKKYFAAKMHVTAIPRSSVCQCASLRERSGLYLLGSPSEMAGLTNSFISRATNIAVFHNRKAASLFQHRRYLQIEDRQCRHQIAELLMKVDKTLGIWKLADV